MNDPDQDLLPTGRLERRFVATLSFLGVALVAAAVLSVRSGHPTRRRAVVADSFADEKPEPKVQALPPRAHPKEKVNLSNVPQPSIILDVYAPDRLRDAMKKNQWVQDALAAPLGRGFLGSWAAFLGARGNDLGGKFQGTVLDLFTTRLLTSPFRVVWFGGPQDPSSPAVLVPNASSEAQAAFSMMDSIAEHGTIDAPGCPVVRTDDKGGEAATTGAAIHFSRWQIADHTIFAGQSGDRLVFARLGESVVAGLCAAAPPMTAAPPGTDVEVALLTSAGLGHESELMTTLLGIGGAPRVAFGVEGDHLVPRGIVADVQTSERLGAASLPDKLLKLVPVDAPVMLSFQVRLPKVLDVTSLSDYFQGKSKGPLEARQAILLWHPRGDSTPSDTALIWSQPKDLAALGKLFEGKWNTVCDFPVFASDGSLGDDIQSTCDGDKPSILNAAPAVAAGLRAKSSVAVGIQFGRVLSQLTHDAYEDEQQGAKPPVEIEDAQHLLEGLPFIGLSGLLQGGKLVPAGFRS